MEWKLEPFFHGEIHNLFESGFNVIEIKENKTNNK